MSCFVRIATRLTDELTLRKAVADLGYQVREGATEARGWNEQSLAADLVIDTRTDYDIGALRDENGTFTFACDWSMARLDEAEFVRQVTRRYSYIQVLEVARRKGFIVASEEAKEQGAVRLLLRKYV